MPASPIGARTRWMVAGVTAVAMASALFLLFRLHPTSEPSGSEPGRPAAARAIAAKPLVQMARATDADTVLKEETEIRDLRPLFLPTEFNVSLPEPRREPGRTFLDNETLKLSYSESELNLARELPSIATLNGKPVDQVSAADALEAERAVPGLSGMGRSLVEPAAAPPTGGGLLEVVVAATGGRAFLESLPADARPAGSKPWEPMELIAMVDAAGLSAPLMITTSSRVEEVDAHYRNYLTHRYRIGARLPPGFYRLVVAP